jgi:hypothetical protein
MVEVVRYNKVGLVQQVHWQKGEQMSPPRWFEVSVPLLISTRSLLISV